MKNITVIIGILLLIGAVAIPVMAWGPHWGGRYHMMGYWGSSPEYGRGSYGTLAPEQKTKLEALDRKIYDETKDLRDQAWAKSRELADVLNSSNPDLEKAKALQTMISDLHSKLDEKRLNYDLEARKILPDQRLGYGSGGWYGRHMGTYGPIMGYGQEYCWN